ncbi:hypothetical protein COCNU_10G009240 [Cocos nucifera]|uniref:Uncharacterized protein n=1 Tax=Cocos nucifera TaxID=13894 RepID=A0A8K0IMJ8_COCNU|nr:hypothetical protein COCNU_10G009240 [Cocos nucifera]
MSHQSFIPDTISSVLTPNNLFLIRIQYGILPEYDLKLSESEMDIDAVERLIKDLYIQKKRKGAASGGSSKRMKVDGLSFEVVDVPATAPEVISGIEVLSIIEGSIGEEEKKKKVEIKIIELEVRMSKSISKAAARAMEEFKASFEMKDLNIAFGQKAFIKGFKLCEGRMVRKFSVLDLSFLKEEPDEEAKMFDAAADPSPIEVIFESSEPIAKVLDPMQELKVVSEVSIEPIPEPVAALGVSSSSASSPSEVGSL